MHKRGLFLSFAVVSAVVVMGSVARADGITVIRVEQDLEGFQAQTGLAIGPVKSTLSRNSNFLCPTVARVELGVFNRGTTQDLKVSQQFVDQVIARLGGQTSARARRPMSKPHEPRVFVGDAELTGLSSADGVRGVLLPYCSLDGWKAEKAARIEAFVASGKPMIRIWEVRSGVMGESRVVEASRDCVVGTSFWDCRVAGYGLARVKPGDARGGTP